MIWFILFQLLGVAVVMGMWFLYSKSKKIYSFVDVVMDNIKKVLISLAVMFLVLTLVMVKPLWYTAKCSIHGTSMSANTKYSWVMGDCLMETKNKSWIPVKISRGIPDGDHDDGDSAQ